MATFGYLEFEPKGVGKVPLVYQLEKGPTTIGTHISHDIRIKSRTARPNDPIVCVIDAKDNGLITLENKSNVPIMFNRKHMKTIRTLKNNDEFEISGKHFRYINSAVQQQTDMDKSFMSRARQSVTSSFKTKSASRIPVSTKNLNIRRSWSAKKPVKNEVSRSCVSALANKKRKPIFDWDSTQSLNVIAGRSSLTSLKKCDDLAVQVRRSLFLKNRGDDLSFSNTIALENKRMVLNIDGSFSREDVSVLEKNVKKTPSPRRGVKRTRETISATIDRKNKRRKHNEKLSFSLSISGTDLLDKSNSSDESSFESIDKSDSLFDLESPQKSRGSIKLLQNESTPQLVSPDLSRKSRRSTDHSSMESVNSFFFFISLIEFGDSSKSSTPKNSLPSASRKSTLRTPVDVVSPSKSRDLSNVRGVKQLLKSPKAQKSPKNDLTDVRGVKKLFKIKQIQKSPRNDLTDVRGVRALLKTFKSPKSPNVSGVEQLFNVEKSPLEVGDSFESAKKETKRGRKKIVDQPVTSTRNLRKRAAKTTVQTDDSQLNLKNCDVSETKKGRRMRVVKFEEKEAEPAKTRGKKRKSSVEEDPKELGEEIQKRTRRAAKEEVVAVDEKQKTTQRGRRGKTAAAVVDDDKEQQTSSPKRGRTRKVVVDESDDKEEKENVQLKKGRRGKRVEVKEETANEEEATKTKRGRRGGGKAVEETNDEEEKEIIKSAARGRKKAAADVAHEAEEAKDAQPRRGRRGKIAQVSNEGEIKTDDVRVTRSTKRQKKNHAVDDNSDTVLNDNDVQETTNTRGRKKRNVLEQPETTANAYNTRRGNK